MPPMQQLMLRDLFRTRQVSSYATVDQKLRRCVVTGCHCHDSEVSTCLVSWCSLSLMWGGDCCFQACMMYNGLVPSSLSFSLRCRSMRAVCAHPGFQPLPPVCNHFDCLFHIALVRTGFHDTLFYYKSFCRSCHSSWRVRSASRTGPLYKTNQREMGVCS